MTLSLDAIVRTSRAVADTSSRNAKIARIAELLRHASPDDVAIATCWLMGELPQGRIGIGPAALRDAHGTHAAEPTLAVGDVDRIFSVLATVTGAGSTNARVAQLRQLFARATPEEQDFLARLLYGELRQGALEGVMADAVAQAAGLPAADVRRAAQLAGDLTSVARAVTAQGAEGLRSFGVQLFRPIQPMLAQPADDLTDALARLGRPALDYKLDGARVQVHRSGAEVRVYTRRLNEVTESVPELVEAARALPARELVLDGEAIALRADGSPHAFQVTMSRFGSRVAVERLRHEVPLSTFFFDCLYLDGASLRDVPAEERFAVMARTLPASIIVPRMVTDQLTEADAFLPAARPAGPVG